MQIFQTDPWMLEGTRPSLPYLDQGNWSQMVWSAYGKMSSKSGLDYGEIVNGFFDSCENQAMASPFNEVEKILHQMVSLVVYSTIWVTNILICSSG